MVFVVIQMLLLAALLGAFLPSEGAVMVTLGDWALWCGRALLVTGVGLALAAGASLGRNTRITPYPAEGARLIERGVYRYLRHPMYTSAWLVCAGMILMRPRVSVVLCAVAVTAFYMIKTRYEERLLLAHYPDYAAYRTRTRGMWLRRGG